MVRAVASGFGFGLLVAAQIGPISLLCMRSVLRHGMRVGVAIGAAAALVDVAYGALGVAGAGRLLDVAGLRVVLGLVGAVVLVVLGSRTLWSAFRVRSGAEADDEVAAVGPAFRTALAATASNPLTIASWAAVFAAASAGELVTGPSGAAGLLAGIGLGTLTWFTVLSGGLALAQRRVGPRSLVAVDAVSGAGLLVFGGLLGWRAARGS